jgi:hypothetical protein
MPKLNQDLIKLQGLVTDESVLEEDKEEEK